MNISLVCIHFSLPSLNEKKGNTWIFIPFYEKKKRVAVLMPTRLTDGMKLQRNAWKYWFCFLVKNLAQSKKSNLFLSFFFNHNFPKISLFILLHICIYGESSQKLPILPQRHMFEQFPPAQYQLFSRACLGNKASVTSNSGCLFRNDTGNFFITKLLSLFWELTRKPLANTDSAHQQ